MPIDFDSCRGGGGGLREPCRNFVIPGVNESMLSLMP